MPIVSLLVAALLVTFIFSMYSLTLYFPMYIFCVCKYLLQQYVLPAVPVALLNYFILYYLMFIIYIVHHMLYYMCSLLCKLLYSVNNSAVFATHMYMMYSNI